MTISSHQHEEGVIMKKRTMQTILPGIVLIVLSLLLSGTNYVSGEQAETDDLTFHDPIMIEGDGNFTSENGVSGGLGTINDPYIISGLYIDASGEKFGIYIKGTTSHFTISGCIIQGASDSTDSSRDTYTYSYRGITLHNVRNALVVDNILYDNYIDDIFLKGSSNCIIRSNTCASSYGWNNIKIESSPDNIIEGNICDPGMIQSGNFTFTKSKMIGISAEGNSVGLIIRNNTVSNHAGVGIIIHNNHNDNSIVKNNTVKFNEDGIEVSGENFRIENNSCMFNEGIGINIDAPKNGLIENNYCYGNGDDGIRGTQPNGYDQSTLIRDNECSNNERSGINLYGFDYEVRNNLLKNNEWCGINIRDKDNLIRDNVIRDNLNFGVYIHRQHGDLGSSTGNMIYRNNFIDNGDGVSAQAVDEDIENMWNSSIIGNYWNDWTWPDDDNNGIVDDPYDLISDNGVSDLLPSAEPFDIDLSKPDVNNNSDPDDNSTSPDDDDNPDDDVDDVHDNEWNEETNSPPTTGWINLSDLDIREGEEFELTASALDPDVGKGDQLSYEWYIDGMGQVGEGETIELELREGDYTIQLKVIDGFGREITVTKDITVRGEGEKWEMPILPVLIGMVIVIIVLLITGGFFLKKRSKNEDGSDDLEIPVGEVPDGPGRIGLKPEGPSHGEMSLMAERGDQITVRSGRISNEGSTLRAPITDLEVEELKMEIMNNKRISPDDKRRELMILLESRKDDLDADSYRAARSILYGKINE